MGFIGDLFGGSGNGAGFKAQGANMDQANQLYGQTQGGLSQQQAFLNALASGNGNAFNQQANLANQLALQSAGGGPNPALDQLAQTTGQNVSNQAALMAGQRGVGANPGLAARQIAQQGAGIQQQANNQASVLRAQQQLASQQQLGGLVGNQISQQGAALHNLNEYGLQGQNNLLNSVGNQNSSNATIASQNAHTQGGVLGQVLGGVGSILGLANGGMVPGGQCYACGGMVNNGYAGGGTVAPMGSDPQMQSFLSQAISESGGGQIPGKAPSMGDSSKNDTVPAMLSPGEVVIPRSKTKDPRKTAEFVNSILGMSLKPAKKGA